MVDGESTRPPGEEPTERDSRSAGAQGSKRSLPGGPSVRIGRRELLLGGASGLALAGAWSVLGGGESDAAAVVREFYDAIDQPDTERAQELVHENAPFGDQMTNASESFLSERNFTVESLSEFDRESAPEVDSVREFVYFSVALRIEMPTQGEEATGTNRVAEQVTVAENPSGNYRIWRA